MAGSELAGDCDARSSEANSVIGARVRILAAKTRAAQVGFLVRGADRDVEMFVPYFADDIFLREIATVLARRNSI